MTLHLFLCGLVLWLGGAGLARQQETPDTRPADTFFAGTVVEYSPEKIIVSRVLQAKTDKREFRITPETKIEGKLRLNVRVTVRYISDEDGDTAILIIVRPPQKKKLL
jgi:hypothetical protein